MLKWMEITVNMDRNRKGELVNVYECSICHARQTHLAGGCSWCAEKKREIRQEHAEMSVKEWHEEEGWAGIL